MIPPAVASRRAALSAALTTSHKAFLNAFRTAESVEAVAIAVEHACTVCFVERIVQVRLFDWRLGLLPHCRGAKVEDGSECKTESGRYPSDVVAK